MSGICDDPVLFSRLKMGALKNTLIAYGCPLLPHTRSSVGGPKGTYVELSGLQKLFTSVNLNDYTLFTAGIAARSPVSPLDPL